MITRAFDSKLDVVDGERSVVATINTACVDRYRTVILPRGGQFDAFRRNPVVLLQHAMGGTVLPIGKCLWIKSHNDRVVAKTQFMGPELSPEADQVFRMFQAGFLNGWSIGFEPGEESPPTTAELRKNPEWSAAHTVYRTWTLLEYSVVAVPANAEALSEAVSRGMELPGWLQQPEPTSADEPVGTELPPLMGRDLRDIIQSTRSLVRREFQLASATQLRDAKDLARGDV